MPPVHRAGERILSPKLLAQVYGVEVKPSTTTTKTVEDRCVEGIDLQRLTGAALAS